MRVARSLRRTYRLEISQDSSHREGGCVCKMSVFSVRSAGYKFGVVLLCLAASSCLWGFAAPNWVTVDLSSFVNSTDSRALNRSVPGTSVNEGLWTYCIPDRITEFKCRSYDIKGYPWWLHLARGLQAVGLLGLILVCFRVLATNCCTASVDEARTRTIELAAGFSGLLAAGGCGVYGYFRNETVIEDAQNESSLSEALWIFYKPDDYTFSWAFYLAVVGSGVAVIAAVIIAVANKRLQATHDERGKIFFTDGSFLRHQNDLPRVPSGQNQNRNQNQHRASMPYQNYV